MGCGSVPGQPLLNAAKKGDTDEVQRLLAASHETEFPDGHGKTPLLRAAKYGHVEVCMMLLQNNADISAVNKDRRSAMHIAVQQGHEPVLRFLMSAGGARLLNAKDAFGDTPADLAEDLPAAKRASVLQILQPKPQSAAQQLMADSTSAGTQEQAAAASQRQLQPQQQPQQAAQPRVVPMPGAASHLELQQQQQQRTPAAAAQPVVVPHPAQGPTPLVHPPPVRVVPMPASRQAAPPQAAAPPQQTVTPIRGQQQRQASTAASITPRGAAPPATQRTPLAGAAPAPAATTPNGMRTPRGAVAVGGIAATATAAVAAAGALTPRGAPGTPLGAGTRTPAGAMTPTPLTPVASAATPRGAGTPLGNNNIADADADVGEDDEAKDFGDLGDGEEMEVDEMKAQAQFEWEAALAASMADGGAAVPRSRWTKVEVSREDYPVILAGAIELLEELEAAVQVNSNGDGGGAAAGGAAGGGGNGGGDGNNIQEEATGGSGGETQALGGGADANQEPFGGGGGGGGGSAIKLNGRKCRHLASRVDSLRPVLLEFQSRISVGGVGVVPEDADQEFRQMLTDAYDLIDDACQLVQDWAACSGGDFGALLKALVADEFAIEFSSMHCGVDDVLEQLEAVADALRMPLDEMPKEWEASFEEEDAADREELMPAALEVVRSSPEAARAVHKLLFEASLSGGDLMVALVEHGLATQGLEEFNTIVEEAGAARLAEQEEYERSVAQAQEQSVAVAAAELTEGIPDATPGGTPHAPGSTALRGTPLGTPHAPVRGTTPMGTPLAPGSRYPRVDPAGYAKEEFGEFQDAEEEFKNDADKC